MNDTKQMFIKVRYVKGRYVPTGAYRVGNTDELPRADEFGNIFFSPELTDADAIFWATVTLTDDGVYEWIYER